MWGHACVRVAVICCACACGQYSVMLSVRCFRLLSSMCRTSEIDGRCVHLRGSDRCEIGYAATLTRSMCWSTFEDPIGVNSIIMLLYSCTRIYTPRVCTLVLFMLKLGSKVIQVAHSSSPVHRLQTALKMVHK